MQSEVTTPTDDIKDKISSVPSTRKIEWTVDPKSYPAIRQKLLDKAKKRTEKLRKDDTLPANADLEETLSKAIDKLTEEELLKIVGYTSDILAEYMAEIIYEWLGTMSLIAPAALVASFAVGWFSSGLFS